MFTVYKSNEINTILSKVCHIIQTKPLSNIFEKEIFVHDNKIIFEYLNIFFAQKIGISANFKFYHPNNFIWKLFQIIVSRKELKNKFTRSRMIWKIMKVLDEKKIIGYYNANISTIQKFKFSCLMANIFEQYIFYRPNWINEWETENDISEINQNEQWQIRLWKEIVHNTKKSNQYNCHFSNLFYNLQKLIKEKKIKQKKLPSRCFVISSFSLNPSYIRILKKISIYIDIYFLYITPYKNNIFNFIENKKILLKKTTQKKNILNDSLITLWGQYEKIYALYLLTSKNIRIVNCFEKNIKKNLLNSIKNDFLEEKKILVNKKKRFLTSTDNSISIHISHSKQDEIEILYNNLLTFFYENPSIHPGDVAVTSFLIDNYIPSIYSVFKSSNKKQQIPFFISRKFSKITEIILSFFNKLLSLSNSRFTNEEILEFLDVSEIAKKFDISEEEIKILYHWIEETNIRWAIDDNHKDYFSFPPNKQNTWLYGIEKLLLSYAMNDTEKIWNDILSCSLINGSRSELIGKLIIFITTLKKWQKKLSKKQYLKYWNSISEDLINDFFYHSREIEKSIHIIKKNWIEMINDSLSSNYSNKISIDILKKNFFYKCHYINNEKILPGVVNFCHPASICYIPFKIVCIIGADHLSIPKINYLDNFNLLKQYPLIGDINIHEKYYYLFLQNISCAKKYLYISYIGYSTEYKSKIYPSFLVDQLLKYIALNFCLIEDQDLTLEENTKKIIKHLCKKYKKNAFYKKRNINFFIKENIQDTHENLKKNIDNKCLSKKNDLNKIILKDLINFWKNPIQYFFNFHLQIKFDVNRKTINTTEPFLVNQSDSFKIKNMLLNKIINNQDTTQLSQYYILSGKLPYHFFGKIFWNESIKEIKSIANEVMKYRFLTQEKKINLTIEKYKICGMLSEIQSTGLLRWKPSTIKHSDRISLWLEHLIYSISGGYGESKIIGYKNKNWFFSSLHPDIAYTYLLKYIKGYIEGIKKPILLTKSGSFWLDQVYDTKNNCIKNDYDTQKKGYKKFLETWIGNNYVEGERENFYIKKLIVKLNKKNIKNIFKTSQKWLIPILQHKK